MDNSNQIEFWNSESADKWVTHAELLDGMLAPFADAVSRAACLAAGEHVIDIGCGAGALTLLCAQQVNDAGSATGVDVSRQLVELARARAQAAGSPARFVLDDASTWQPDTPADAAVSRFGVMFFAEPAEAFASIRAGLKPGGRLVFACWQSLALNDWARAPLEVALPFLKEPPVPPSPDAPGPFAFADKHRLAAILASAGFGNVEITGWQGELTVPGETASDAASFAIKLGPVSRLLQDQKIDIGPVEAALRTRMEQHRTPEGRVALDAATWIVTARA